MKTAYEQAVLDLAEVGGQIIAIGNDRVAMLSIEARTILLKPSDEEESGLTAFAIVAQGADDKPLERSFLENALGMDLFGRGTDGGHIGIFGNALIYSRDLPLAGVTTETLAETLVGFSRMAGEMEVSLGGSPSRATEADAEGMAPFDTGSALHV